MTHGLDDAPPAEHRAQRPAQRNVEAAVAAHAAGGPGHRRPGTEVPVVPALRGIAAAELAEHLTAAAQGRIGATELNDIMARAEGNAYYAEELLAASLSGDRQEQSLPAGLAALLLSRVEQLSDAAQQVLRAAAVAGRKADDELVQAASGLMSADYEAAVREAVTHQLLVPDGTLQLHTAKQQ